MFLIGIGTPRLTGIPWPAATFSLMTAFPWTGTGRRGSSRITGTLRTGTPRRAAGQRLASADRRTGGERIPGAERIAGTGRLPGAGRRAGAGQLRGSGRAVPASLLLRSILLRAVAPR
jgi:hypothetical protein